MTNKGDEKSDGLFESVYKFLLEKLELSNLPGFARFLIVTLFVIIALGVGVTFVGNAIGASITVFVMALGAILFSFQMQNNNLL